MPDDKPGFLQRAKIAANKVYLDATNTLVMNRPSYGRDQSEKRTAVEMSRRQGEQEYWDYLKRNNADEFYKQASVNLGQTSGPRPMDALTEGAQQVAGAYGAGPKMQTAVGVGSQTAQTVVGGILARGGGMPRLEEPMPMKAPGMRLNLAPGKAMEIAKVKGPVGGLGELEAGLQASAKRMFPSVEERTAGTQIGDAIAARQTEGGHGGGGVASVEELNRQREYVNVGRGKTGYQGVQPDPGARGIEPGRAIYSTPKGKAEWRLESGTPAADHQGALDGWAKAMGRTSVKVGGAAVAGALVGAGTASAASPSPEDIDKMVTKHAEANNLDPKLLHEVVRSESSYNPNAWSGKGARGLTQLMPATAKAMGVNPKDPEQNVSGGAKYLAQLRERFGDLRKTLAAYNWGPTNVAKHGDAWYEHAPQETRNYVDRIMQRYGGAVKTAQVNPSGEGGEWSTTDPQRQ